MSVNRPQPNGKTVFLPIEVGVDSWGMGVNPFTKHFYCGKCRKQMGWGAEYHLYELCPRCGAEIGDWRATGMTEVVVKEGRGSWVRLPDYWPNILNGSSCISALELAETSSVDTVNDPELHGSGLARIE